MKPSEKRKTTQPGLGKATGEPRRTTLREGVTDEPAPLSVPAPGADRRPVTGQPPARHTRAIESSPPRVSDAAEAALEVTATAAAPSEPPPSTKTIPSRPPSSDRSSQSQPIDRGEPGAPPGPQSDRFPVDVTHAVERFESKERPTGRRAISGRPAAERPISNRPAAERPISNRPAARPITGRPAARPITGRPAARPITGRPAAPSPKTSPSPSAEPRSATATARSRRVSIREDNVGEGLHRTPNAPLATSGPSSQQVPRLTKTKAEIAAAPIDHRAGFLLAHIDGTTNVQGLVDIAGMAETEVHEILERLRRLGIVAIR